MSAERAFVVQILGCGMGPGPAPHSGTPTPTPRAAGGGMYSPPQLSPRLRPGGRGRAGSLLPPRPSSRSASWPLAFGPGKWLRGRRRDFGKRGNRIEPQ